MDEETSSFIFNMLVSSWLGKWLAIDPPLRISKFKDPNIKRFNFHRQSFHIVVEGAS